MKLHGRLLSKKRGGIDKSTTRFKFHKNSLQMQLKLGVDEKWSFPPPRTWHVQHHTKHNMYCIRNTEFQPAHKGAELPEDLESKKEIRGESYKLGRGYWHWLD